MKEKMMTGCGFVVGFTNKWFETKGRTALGGCLLLIAVLATGWLWYQIWDSITSVAMCSNDATSGFPTPKRFHTFDAQDGTPRIVSGKT
jgi:hypothetical protein